MPDGILESKTMLALDDPKWKKLKGGYRVLYDPTPALRKLAQGKNAWKELWENLHHQGDVGDASYAVVPQLVAMVEDLPRTLDFYGLISTIEMERHRKGNPKIPAWLRKDYRKAVNDLYELAAIDLRKTKNSRMIPWILAAMAFAKGEIKLGTFLCSDPSEIDEILEESLGWSKTYDNQP